MNIKLKLILACAVFVCQVVFVASVNQPQSTGLLVVEQEDENGGASVDTIEESFIDPDIEDFIPTHEWQNVQPGQAVPPGLHIRLNLQTGEKEAKLLDEVDAKEAKESDDPAADTSRLKRVKNAMEQAMKDLEENANTDTQKSKPDIKYWKSGDQEGMVNLGKDHFTQQELKEAMKKFKADKDDVQEDEVRKESVKKKYRSIEELKMDMEDVHMAMKTDLEILRDIHTKYNTEEVTLKLNLLEDLEYYVHQIDNAVNFVDLGLLELVIKDLNHTTVSVKSAAAFVIGSAVQSNPKVQVQVIESGAMHQFIRLLSTETSSVFLNRVLYATSGLIRHFPYAQLKFLEQGGFHTLRDLFVQSVDERIKLKIVTLIGDLVHEHSSFQDTPEKSNNQQFQERRKQYELIPLIQSISEYDWCNLIPTLLTLPSHDTREKTLSTMRELLPICKQYFTHTSIQEHLKLLKTEYSSLAAQENGSSSSDNSFEDDSDVYFKTLSQIITQLLNEISIRDEL